MAAAVETMAYAGEVPWHGEGTNVSDKVTVEEMQAAAGLNWTVSKRPVMYDRVAGGEQTFKDRFVLARDTDDKPFSVVSGRYKPVQPKDILGFFKDLLSRYGMTMETAGSLMGGKRIWAMAKTNEAYKVMGVDEIKGYLMVATSYDLTFSTLAYFTSVRVVCNNTLQASFGDMVNRISIPHFKDFDINSIHTQMGMGRENWEAFTAACESLTKIKLDVAKANQVLEEAYQFENDPVKDSLKRKDTNNIIDLFSGKAIGADVAGQTGWGLINATTQYLDQIKRAHSAGNRLNSAWFGDSFNTKQRVLDTTLKLAA